MSYDLVDEINLQEYRMNNMKDCDMWSSYEQPDKEKWKNLDCPQCHEPFGVIKLGKRKGRLCMKCGWPNRIIKKDEL